MTPAFDKGGMDMGGTAFELPPGVSVRHELEPGDIGYVIYLHGALYAKEYGWDYTFEAYVAEPLARFALAPGRGRMWIVEKDGTVAGSIAIVEVSREEAQLRWFLLHPSLRGFGLGRHLLHEAIGFCREHDYSTIFLWTVDSLQAAIRLYRSSGFVLTEEKPEEIWGTHITEQRFELRIKHGSGVA